MRNIKTEELFLNYLKIIGANVERLRGGMSQLSLAKKAHVGRSTIRAIEEGRMINLRNLIKIAEALGMKPADLFITDVNRGEISYKHKLLMDLISKKDLGG